MSALPPPIPYQDAQQRLLDMAAPLEGESRAIEAALGRYLAAPVIAERTQPSADLSAMDGYAMAASGADSVNKGPWKIIGESAAGHPFTGTLTGGEAVRISTGALMPQSANAVLLQENTTREGNTLALSNEDGPTSRHIRRAGLDFQAGDELISKGAQIGPAQVALALSGGHSALTIGRLPSIAILDSGDELAVNPENVALHQIPASNGAMLEAMSAPFVSSCQRLGPIADNLDDICAAIGRSAGANVLVTSGGASVGDHDLIRPAMEKMGAQIAFWRIAIKPGKPLMVAKRGEQIIIGLPGNPVSSYVTAFLFLLPLLRHLAGSNDPLPRAIQLPLAQPLPANGPRALFLRSRISENGLEVINQQDSSALASLASAQALIERPIDAPAAQIGDIVPAILL